jgi:N-acetylneuraminate lyase
MFHDVWVVSQADGIKPERAMEFPPPGDVWEPALSGDSSLDWNDPMPGLLTGLIPASHTPFDRDGRLNLAMVPRQAELFRESGFRAVFIAGTTGEWASMTLEERTALCERWMEVAGDSLRVVVHVGHHCQADAVRLATHARQVGAAAVAAVAPSYFKPSTVDDLIEFCMPIAAEADPLAFYFYDIPVMTAVRLPMPQFLHEARFRIPNLRGVKYSNNDLVGLQECVNVDNGTFEVLFGCDEFLLAGLCLGVRGAVGSTYNFAGPHYQRLIRAFESGDLPTARAAQFQAVEMITTLYEFGFSPASKAVMAMLGVDCGPVRPPLRNLSATQLAALARKLASFDVFARPLKRPE